MENNELELAMNVNRVTEPQKEMEVNVANNPIETNTIGVDQPSPEFLQRKLYFLVEQLKMMHSKLPELVKP